MKTRRCFVSNSSSSSYVILGFVDNIEDFESTEEEDAFFNSHIYTEEVGYIKGEELTRDRDYMLENAVFSIPELMAKAKKIAEENNISVDEVKLFMGTRAC